jgi:WD40 repeat protein
MRIIFMSKHCTSQVWDAENGHELKWSRDEHGLPITSASFSPDGLRILTADGYKGSVWDAASGEQLLELSLFESPRDYWDLNEKEQEQFLKRFRSLEITAASFSLDGRCVMTITRDKDAQLWDADSGTYLNNFGFIDDDMLRLTNAFRSAQSHFATGLDRTLSWRTIAVNIDPDCPMCLGKGYVDSDDIERHSMIGYWLPGRCRLCAAVPVPPLAEFVFQSKINAFDSQESGLIAAGLQNGQVCFLQYEEVE